MAATFARGTSSLVAVRTLAEHRFGIHAQMLCRSLFEDALTATWIQATRPPELEARHDAHIYLVRKLVTLTSNREPTREEVKAALTNDERRLFGEFGNGPWTGRSSFQQMQDLSSVWRGVPDEAGRLEGLWMYQRTFQRMNSTLLHHSPIGLDAFYAWEAGQALELRIADQGAESFDALVLGLVSFGFLLLATIECFIPEQKPELFRRRSKLMRDIDAAHVRRVSARQSRASERQ